MRVRDVELASDYVMFRLEFGTVLTVQNI